MKKLSIDIMTMGGAKFYRSLQYPFNPIFQLDMKQVYPWIMDRLPLLMYEKNIVLFIDFPSELRFKNESQRILFGEDIIFSFKEYYG